MKNISLLGAGSWGTALAITLAKNGHKVTLWSALSSEITLLQTHREHVERLPGVKLPDNIEITDNLQTACTEKDLIVFSVASPYVRSTAKQCASFIKDGQIIVNVSKGIEEDTLMTLTDIISQEIPQSEVTVLSGPSHAEEVSKGIPTTVVVGAAVVVGATVVVSSGFAVVGSTTFVVGASVVGASVVGASVVGFSTVGVSPEPGYTRFPSSSNTNGFEKSSTFTRPTQPSPILNSAVPLSSAVTSIITN